MSKIKGLDKEYSTDNAIVVSKLTPQCKHCAWIIGNYEVIVADVTLDYGLRILTFASVKEYLKEFKISGVWRLNLNKHIDSLKKICKKLDINIENYIDLEVAKYEGNN